MFKTRNCIASYAICFLVIHIKVSNSRLSWQLNADKVIRVTIQDTNAELISPTILKDDMILDILTSSLIQDNSQGWSKSATYTSSLENLRVHCNECKNNSGLSDNQERRFSTYALNESTSNDTGSSFAIERPFSGQLMCGSINQSCENTILDCGRPVNFTYYDNLLGVVNRNKHPLVPEPNVVFSFSKNEGKIIDFDLDVLERRLKHAKKEKPKSVQLYNQIGNFWRIKGNAQRSIECFRRALAVSPHNAEVLLNLARVLLILEYLDDASYLTRRSLELQPPDRSAWEQYLTLGQIHKAYGHFQEAAVHLRHALEMKPDLQDAIEALKEVESFPIASIHIYTLLIIVCLVLGVLLVVLSNIECEDESSMTSESQKCSQRHFNRGVSVRSFRINVPRSKRC